MAAMLSRSSGSYAGTFCGAVNYGPLALTPGHDSALEIARRVRGQFGSEVGVSLVAPFRPGPDTPVVDYFVSVITPDREETVSLQFGSNPDLFTRMVSWRALDTLRRML
jgi:hypothetical protein